MVEEMDVGIVLHLYHLQKMDDQDKWRMEGVDMMFMDHEEEMVDGNNNLDQEFLSNHEIIQNWVSTVGDFLGC
jgi:fructose/tagatose bisphosphate aldolase